VPLEQRGITQEMLIRCPITCHPGFDRSRISRRWLPRRSASGNPKEELHLLPPDRRLLPEVEIRWLTVLVQPHSLLASAAICVPRLDKGW